MFFFFSVKTRVDFDCRTSKNHVRSHWNSRINENVWRECKQLNSLLNYNNSTKKCWQRNNINIRVGNATPFNSNVGNKSKNFTFLHFLYSLLILFIEFYISIFENVLKMFKFIIKSNLFCWLMIVMLKLL